VTTDVGDLGNHTPHPRIVGGGDDRQPAGKTRPPNTETLAGIELRLRFGEGDGVTQIGDVFEHVQLLPRFALGGAPAAIIEIEHGKASFGEEGRVPVDVGFHPTKARTHDDPGMSARARRVQVGPQDRAVFGLNLGPPHSFRFLPAELGS
jgi:hypothetical protein